MAEDQQDQATNNDLVIAPDSDPEKEEIHRRQFWIRADVSQCGASHVRKDRLMLARPTAA